MIRDDSLKKKQQLEREEAFEREFTRHGFTKVHIEADGNCAFRAVRKLGLTSLRFVRNRQVSLQAKAVRRRVHLG
jgi:hypothetical protein